MHAVFHLVGSLLTYFEAFPAADTLGIKKRLNDNALGDRFGIVAPNTFQVAAFQEHRCAHAIPVMQGNRCILDTYPLRRAN